MKKLIFLLFIICPFFVFAQSCTPDPQYNGQTGMHPDTVENFVLGNVGLPYSQVITVVVPSDTTINFPGIGTINLIVNYSMLDSIVGLPIGFSYACNPSNCQFSGGTSGCIVITGDPQSIGEFPLDLYMKLNVTHALLGTFDTPYDTLTGYKITIDQGTNPTSSFSIVSSTICEDNSVTFNNSSTGSTSYTWSFPGANPSTSSAINPTVVYNNPGNYTATLTAHNGVNTDISTLSFSVSASPSVNITAAGSTTICNGEQVQLVANATGASQYQWQFNQVNLSGETFAGLTANQDGTYTVVVTNASGCTGTDAQTVNVITPGFNISCNATTNLFTVPPFLVQFNNTSPNISNYNFKWFFGDGTSLSSNNSVVTHEYQYNGIYDVTMMAYIQPENCKDSVYLENYVYCSGGIDSPNGIEELGINNIEIYPNPATDNLTISFEVDNVVMTDISIVTPSGLFVYNETLKINSGKVQCFINSIRFASGIYFLKINSEGRLTTVKFIIR